jgi:hypothetical protein
MIFTVRAGKHKANRRWRRRLLFGNTLRFRYRIAEGADYDYANIVNGWSKLYGMASPFVHGTSLRIVFRNDATGLRAGIYAYIGGKSPQQNSFQKQDIGMIMQGFWYNVEINRFSDCWMVSHGIEGSAMDVFQMPNCSMKVTMSPYRLPFHIICHPYVGGRFTLPNDVIIEVEHINKLEQCKQ